MNTIKTLLLCNIEHEEKIDVAEIYKNIYCGKTDGQSNCGRRYFALGNTDAFSIYDTPHTESAPHLSDIYEDKKTIKRNISQELSNRIINYTYHPIYLVEPDDLSLKEKQSDKLEEYAFCVVTLAYGISYGEFDYKKEEFRSKSRFESRIREFTDKNQDWLIADKTDETQSSEKDKKVRLLMYNAVNICDAVIMLYSNNLANALRIARNLTSLVVGEGEKAEPVAKKTYTMVGFQITDAFKKTSFLDSSYLVTKRLMATRLMATNDSYDLRIHGTVKDYSKFDTLSRNLFETQLKGNGAAMLGRDDFRVEIRADGCKLSGYLNALLTLNEYLSEACQEIHTEFVFPFDLITEYKASTGDSISGFYDNANHFLHKTLDKLDKSNGPVSPWILAYRELLANYQNIKKSPVLRDSAYIIYDFVKTVNTYIKEHTKFAGSLDIPGNQERASITIRNWISLTEQMTRVDDLIFTGFGHTPAITNTLPESILEYYHAVIRKLVDGLLNWDEDYYNTLIKQERVAVERKAYYNCSDAGINTADLTGETERRDDKLIRYDFLMVPALNQRFQIVQMFDADYEYRIKTDEKCPKQGECTSYCQNCWRLRHWPQTQVYLINFSSEDLYRPVEFFPKLVHEVFHTFGDAFRCREDRQLFAAMFLAATWTRNINLNEAIPDQNKINGIIIEYLTNELLEVPQRREPHLQDTMDGLQKRLKEIRQDPGSITGILKKIKAYNVSNGTTLLDNNYWIFDEKFGLRWRSGFDKDWDIIIEQEEYLFKECFADVMMIHLLQLPVGDYIKLLRFETSQPIGSEKDGEWLVLQRFAAVISECYSENQEGAWNQFNESDVEDTIREIYGQTNGNPGDDLPQTKNADNLITLVQSLIKNENRRFNNGDIEKKTFPPLALKALCMYLNDAIKKFNETIDNCSEKDNFISEIQKTIKEDGLFTPAYYRLIHERHENIRSENAAPAS